jgi:hypothetical protein
MDPRGGTARGSISSPRLLRFIQLIGKRFGATTVLALARAAACDPNRFTVDIDDGWVDLD